MHVIVCERCTCECEREIEYERDLYVCFDCVLGPPSMCFILIFFIVYNVNSSFKLMLLFFYYYYYFVYIFLHSATCEGQVLVLNVHKNLWSNQWLSYFIRSVVVNCMHYINQFHGDVILKAKRIKIIFFCTKAKLIIFVITHSEISSQI